MNFLMFHFYPIFSFSAVEEGATSRLPLILWNDRGHIQLILLSVSDKEEMAPGCCHFGNGRVAIHPLILPKNKNDEEAGAGRRYLGSTSMAFYPLILEGYRNIVGAEVAARFHCGRGMGEHRPSILRNDSSNEEEAAG